MPDLLIAVGGTGQHVALAVSRLVFLGALPEMELAVIDSEDATELPSSLKSFGNTVEPGYTEHPLINGTMIYPPFDKKADRDPKFQDLFLSDHPVSLDKEIFDTCFEEESAGISIKEGMFGRPSVGATIFAHNKDTELATIFERAQQANNIFVSGSIVGGTGAGLIHQLIRTLQWNDCRIYGLIFLNWFLAASGGPKKTISDHTLERNMRYGLDYFFSGTRSLLKASLLIGVPDEPPSDAVGPIKLEEGNTQEKQHCFHLLASYGILRLPSIAVTEKTDGSIYAAAYEGVEQMYGEVWEQGKELNWYVNRANFVKEILHYASSAKFKDEMLKTLGRLSGMMAKPENVGLGLHEAVKRFDRSQHKMVVDEITKTWRLLCEQYKFSLAWMDSVLGPLPEKLYNDTYKAVKDKDPAKADVIQRVWKDGLPEGQENLKAPEVAREFHKRLVESF
jgi:hypothetical protein